MLLLPQESLLGQQPACPALPSSAAPPTPPTPPHLPPTPTPPAAGDLLASSLQALRRAVSATRPRLLVATPSNAACDELMWRVMHQRFVDSLGESSGVPDMLLLGCGGGQPPGG